MKIENQTRGNGANALSSSTCSIKRVAANGERTPSQPTSQTTSHSRALRGADHHESSGDPALRLVEMIDLGKSTRSGSGKNEARFRI